MSDISNFLEHHGVKGQRWGVRRKRSAKETRVRAKRQKALKNRRTLSDADIQKYVERLSAEKKLKSLVEEDLTPGRKAAKQLVSEGGQKVVKTVGTGLALLAIKAAVEKKLSPKGSKIKLDPKSTADLLIRGAPKK